MSKDCFLYVIAIDGQAISKVGISASPKGRLDQLQTGSPFKMRIVHQFRLPQRDMAAHVERAFHETQREHRMNGEWFSIEPQKAVFLCWMAIETFMVYSIGLDEDERAKSWSLIGRPALDERAQ